MNAEQLKKSLLQMAMQGKLVEQREEEPAVEQLGEAPDDTPFVIPEKWKWVKLENCVQINPKITADDDTDVSFVPMPLLQAGYESRMDMSNIKKWKEVKKGFTRFCNQDVVLAKITPCFENRKSAIVINAKNGIGAGTTELHVFRCNKHLIPEYLLCFFKTPYLIQYGIDHFKGTAGQQRIGIADLKSCPFPLPPLAEQQRIVEKLDHLLPLVETYGKAQSELKAMEAALPAQLKKSLLQMAMQGKLVEQREEEGNARELLEKIQKEKQRLIKEGKIKKEKSLPEITENEKPFDIPENWVWVRLRQLVYNKGQKVPDTDFCYIDIGSIDNSSQKLGKENTILTPNEAPLRARKIVSSGDILYSTVRPYLHNMCILDRDFPFPPIASTGFAVMTCLSGCFNRFLFYYLMSPDFDRYANSTNNAKGIAYPAINDEKLYRALIPLPPLAEQRRIVQKLDHLLPLCDKLVGN